MDVRLARTRVLPSAFTSIMSAQVTIDEGSFYSQMQTLREKADYNCYFKVSEAEVTARIEPTRSLIEKIKKYIAEKQAQ